MAQVGTMVKLPNPLTEWAISAVREIVTAWQGSPEPFWSFEETIASLKRPEIVAFGLQKSGDLEEAARFDAFLLAEVGHFSSELLYIYVRPECRRGGLGREIFQYFMSELEKSSSVESLFLEVRRSNEAAQRLYRQMGLAQVGLRQAYYRNGEDAFVFKKDLLSRSK